MNRVVCLPLLLLLLCSLVAAEEPAEPEEPASPPTAYELPDYLRNPPTLPPHLRSRPPRLITLVEAIEIALQRNLGLQMERERVREVAAGRGLALSGFEPLLLLNGGYGVSQSPPATAQEGQAGQVLRNSSATWNLRLLQRLPTGTLLTLDFNNSRQDSALGTAVAPLLYRSSLLLGLTQPLLRDFSLGGRVQWAPVLRAAFDSETARESARLRALLTVKLTEDAYWTLVESWKRYEVTRTAAELAGRQLALTRRRIAAGIVAPSDVIGVEGTLAQRQVTVVSAEAQIEDAADNLRRLMNLPPEAWDQPLLPMDVPGFTPTAVTFEAAWARALAARPELQSAQIDLRRIGLDLEVAYNARLPRLNLQAAVGAVGQEADYGPALQQLRGLTGWQWSVGADFNWAPVGVGARAEIRRLHSVRQQRGLSREQLLVDIRGQLRGALRAIDTARRQLFAAAKSRDLAERSLDIEGRRFLNGIGDNYILGQRQGDLAQARLSEMQALIQHERASSDLQLAMGELLEARHLRFELRPGPR